MNDAIDSVDYKFDLAAKFTTFWFSITIYITVISELYQYFLNFPTGTYNLQEVYWYFLIDRVSVAAGEEFVFRMPLVLVLILFPKSKTMLWASIGILSCIFGIYHGFGSYQLLNQGVVGVLYSISFLHFGAREGKYMQAFVLNSALHVITNLSLFILDLLVQPSLLLEVVLFLLR